MLTPLRAAALGALTLSVAAATAVYGSAASLTTTSTTAAAAKVTVVHCPTAATTVFENVVATNIVSVTVSGIDATCAGGTLSVTVYNGAASGSGSIAVPGGGGTVTVTLGAAVAFVDNARADLVIAGP